MSSLIDPRVRVGVARLGFRPGTSAVILVAAVADNGVIGRDGDLPWRVPEDFAHFKALTMGHVLVMGRTTYESIGRPLPGRTTIVLTRNRGWEPDGGHPQVRVAHTLRRALNLAAKLGEQTYVVGGASVYSEALSKGFANFQVLTEVHIRPPGDTRYPNFNRSEWTEVWRDPFLSAEIPHEFVWYRKREDLGGK